MSENYRAFWDEALRQIGEEYKKNNQEGEFKLWFNMTYVGDEGNTIMVNVPSAFFWVQMEKKGFVGKVEDVLQQLTGQTIELSHVVTGIPVAKEEPKKLSHSEILEQAKIDSNEARATISQAFGLGQSAAVPAAGTEQPSAEKDDTRIEAAGERGAHPLLDSMYRFDTFVTGKNNDFAYSACVAIAKKPGQNKSFNPLLLYGGSGLGKTHLMQSVGNYIWEHNEEKLKICYIATENFTNQFYAALKANNIDSAFTKKFRSYDVFLLDDIQGLIGKKQLQNELFGMFDALKSHKAQMIFTCDRPISEFKDMEDRLKSRLGSGTSIDMQPPSFETRLAILQKKLELMKTSGSIAPEVERFIPEDVLSYIAKNVQSNVRDLEGCLNKVVGYADLTQNKLDIAATQNLLRDNFVDASTDAIPMETVQRVVADHYNISLSDIKGKNRSKKYVLPRQIAIYIGRTLLDYSFPELGEEFGGKDHTTMMHSFEKIVDMLKVDASMDTTIKMLIREIKDYKK